MASINIRPSRTLDVMDVSGYYATQMIQDDPHDTTMPTTFYNNSPEPHRGLNRKQRRTETSKLRRKKLL